MTSQNYLIMQQALRHQPDAIIAFVHEHERKFREYLECRFADMTGRDICMVIIDMNYDGTLKQVPALGNPNMVEYHLIQMNIAGFISDASGKLVKTTFNQ